MYIFLHDDTDAVFPYKLKFHAFVPGTLKHATELPDRYMFDIVDQKDKAFECVTNANEMVALAWYYFSRLDDLFHYNPLVDIYIPHLLAVCNTLSCQQLNNMLAMAEETPSTEDLDRRYLPRRSRPLIEMPAASSIRKNTHRDIST